MSEPTHPAPLVFLAALAVSLAAPVPATAEELATLLEFNPGPIQAELLARERFHPVFMAIKERDGRPTELLALRVLLGDPTTGIACERLRKGLSARDESSAAARRDEERRLKEWLDAEKRRAEFVQEYLAYRGPAGTIDPDFFIYTSLHRAVAAMYGEVVFEIREETPRGIDLNGLNRALGGYYDQLTLSERLHPRKLIVRKVVDKDEYVIPSHVPNREVCAVDIRARLPMILGSQMVRLTGRVQRRYQRGGEGDLRWVDLFDRGGVVMARFATDPAAPAPPGPPSSGEIPEEILAAVEDLTIEGRPVRVLR